MANLQRIRTGSTGSLTPLERESLHELVKEYNSDFRVKAATVPFVGDILPEAGVIVISDHDGRMYRADQQGWNLMGVDSPIMLFVDYTDTQFDFKFKAPSTSTINIYDGDGTVTAVAGQDDTEVTHTTDYSEAGTYTFYVEGDYLDLTSIKLASQPVSGDVSSFSELVNLTVINIRKTGVSGNISGWSVLTSLGTLLVNETSLYGDISSFATLVNVTNLNVSDSELSGNLEDLGGMISLITLDAANSNLSGDISGVAELMPSLLYFEVNGNSGVEFNSVGIWPNMSIFDLTDCTLTSTMVDNCLISLANGSVTGATINIGGNNAARTSASDAAMVTLEAAGNTITVNE